MTFPLPALSKRQPTSCLQGHAQTVCSPLAARKHPGLAACLAGSLLALPVVVWAQAAQPLPPTDWTRANAAVAEFPRGHADVLKWEQRNLPAEQAQTAVGGAETAATVAGGLSLMSPEAAVRQAWGAHRSLVRPLNRMGAAQANLVAQGRWTEVDPTLQRRVGDMDELLAVATQGRKAWVQAVAARQVLVQHRTALAAADAANELGRRMVSVGNWSRLQQSQVQLAQSSARMALRRAQYAAAQAEAALLKVLNLTATHTAVNLPDRLPDLPMQPLAPQVLAERAAAIADQLPRAEGVRNVANARLAQHAYLASHALALSARDEVVKTRELITEDTVLHYNGMLKSVWDLLGEVGNQSQAVVSAIEAQRDFWLAEADLQWVLQGGAPASFVSLGGGGGEPAAPAGH